jgi:hypothetical protein
MNDGEVRIVMHCPSAAGHNGRHNAARGYCIEVLVEESSAHDDHDTSVSAEKFNGERRAFEQCLRIVKYSQYGVLKVHDEECRPLRIDSWRRNRHK